MEALRRALGDGKLNFLGLSYGAHLGSAYAELYPRRIRTMALDAIANHSSSVNTLFSDAAATYEDTLDRFAAWCAQTSSCPLHGRDVLALFDSVVQRADQQPIPAPECADGSCRPTVTGGEIRMQALFLLRDEGGGAGARRADVDRLRERPRASRTGGRERVLDAAGGEPD